ncbi:hypothetical protein GCM10028778_27260 [Barrientosiimonas marina]|uniref:MFS transporter n=1 Tax=Lentibacillus kimchii TaxID=1542911 RepID=A0ABW2UVS0_9BACI
MATWSAGTITSLPLITFAIVSPLAPRIGRRLGNFPAIIKENFPHRVGRMTSAYSTSMAVFAATASGVFVPLIKNAGMGWELALLSWGILALAAIIVCLFVIRKDTPEAKENNMEDDADAPVEGSLLKSPLAWQVTFFMRWFLGCWGEWTVSIFILVIVSVLLTLAGLGAGRDKCV